MRSVLTDNMDVCMFIGQCMRSAPLCKNRRCYDIERHHVFGGFNRDRSTKYGYIAPITRELHPNGIFAPDNWKEIDTMLKRMCQQHFEQTHTREEFIKEFGRSYL